MYVPLRTSGVSADRAPKKYVVFVRPGGGHCEYQDGYQDALSSCAIAFTQKYILKQRELRCGVTVR